MNEEPNLAVQSCRYFKTMSFYELNQNLLVVNFATIFHSMSQNRFFRNFMVFLIYNWIAFEGKQ